MHADRRRGTRPVVQATGGVGVGVLSLRDLALTFRIALNELFWTAYGHGHTNLTREFLRALCLGPLLFNICVSGLI